MYSVHPSFLYILSFSLPWVAGITVPILFRGSGSALLAGGWQSLPIGQEKSFSKGTTGRSRAEIDRIWIYNVSQSPSFFSIPCQQFLHIKVNNFSFVSFNYHYDKTFIQSIWELRSRRGSRKQMMVSWRGQCSSPGSGTYLMHGFG